MILSTLEHRSGLQASGEYAGYRRYASRRVKKLRHRAGLSAKLGKSGKLKELRPADWPIAVLLAERCWAAAMVAQKALDADATAEAGSAASLRNHVHSKLVKAQRYAQAALTLHGSDTAAKGPMKLEFGAYLALLAGDVALQKQQWQRVAESYSKARVALLKLNQDEGSEVYREVLSTRIDPALRLALAQLDKDYGADLAAATRELVAGTEFAEYAVESPEAQEASSKIQEIKFMSHVARVRDAGLATALLTAQKRDSGLRQAAESAHVDAAQFEGAIEAWADAEYVVETLIAEQNSTGRPHEQDLDIVATYVRFHLLARRIERDSDVAVAERAAKGSANAVRLYDVVLQSCATMAELPGVFNDDSLVSGISAMQSYFQTLRTLALAATHAVGSREALALVNLAYVRLKNDDLPKTIPPELGLPVTSAQISSVVDVVKAELARAHGLALIYAEAANRSTMKGSIASDYKYFQVAKPGSKLVVADVNVERIEPIPVKPTFYDLAFNYVHRDEANARLVTDGKQLSALGLGPGSVKKDSPVEPEAKESKKKGLFGIF